MRCRQTGARKGRDRCHDGQHGTGKRKGCGMRAFSLTVTHYTLTQCSRDHDSVSSDLLQVEGRGYQYHRYTRACGFHDRSRTCVACAGRCHPRRLQVRLVSNDVDGLRRQILGVSVWAVCRVRRSLSTDRCVVTTSRDCVLSTNSIGPGQNRGALSIRCDPN